MALIAKPHGDGFVLQSPMPGKFRPSIATGASLEPGSSIGILDVLGNVHELVVPAGAAGFATTALAARTVQFGDVIVELAAGAIAGAAKTVAAAAESSTHGLVFRAPTSGRFYGRSTPDKPPFVTAGAELVAGTTICLLEVMKTFHRVHYGGADMPERAKVREVLVKDGDDVNAGDPLLALDPI
jgi:biotin carboxyl carrier protein